MNVTIDEAGIVELASKEASWEEVLEYIITEEGMDPWDVDIVRLADAFRAYVERMGTLEFQVPARLIIIAAVLLHMKAEVMMWEEEQRGREQKQEAPIDLSRVPELEVPAKRLPTRRVTLEELVHALEKAFRTQERRELRVERAREHVEEVVATEERFDITAKINELYARINDVVEQLRSGTLPFSKLVTRWERREIVESLLGILHMSTDGRVLLVQEEPFREIYVTVTEGEKGRETSQSKEKLQNVKGDADGRP